MRPLVSVVIPTFNRKAVLLEAVASVQRQPLQALEILVCDDGSTDGSAEALAELATQDPRVRWLPGAHCGFPGIVRNRGIRAARGEWVAFQDSDDLWMPEKLERQLAVLERHPQAQVIYSHAAALFPDGSRERMTPFRVPREGRVLETFLLYSIVHTPTVLARKALLDEVGGFDESMELRIGEDYELFLRLAARAPFHFVDEDLVLCRTQADSTSADLFGGIDAFERVLRATLPKMEVSPALASEALCRIELRRYKHHLLRGHSREARMRDLRQALRLRPWHRLGRALLAAELAGCAPLVRRALIYGEARSAARAMSRAGKGPQAA